MVLAKYLRLNGLDVTTVENAIDCLALLTKKNDFHVALIDLGLPDMSGQVVAEYARKTSKMSVVILTANDALENRIHSFEKGADMFIAKPVDNRELLAIIQAMEKRFQERSQSDGPLIISTDSSANAEWQLDPTRRNLNLPSGRQIALNQREFILMETFCAYQGNAVKRSELVQIIYHRDDDSAQHALDTMIRRLRHKIRLVDKAQSPILTTYGVGYSFTEPLNKKNS
jgi:DNA-binding response OmpR family regulator